MITGGSSGIGMEFVKQFTLKGNINTIITGRDLSRLEAASLPVNCIYRATFELAFSYRFFLFWS